MGALIALLLGYNPFWVQLLLPLSLSQQERLCQRVSAYAGVLKEVWTGELIRALRAYLDASWLVGVPDQSSIVDNDVIHMVDVGVDL